MPPPMPGPCPPGAGFSFSGTSVMRHSVVKSSPAMEAAFCSAVDRKSTRLNSSHLVISYAVFCLKKKRKFVMHRVSDRPQRLAVCFRAAIPDSERLIAHCVTGEDHASCSVSALPIVGCTTPGGLH